MKTLHAIEEWTGHRHPPGPVSLARFILAAAALAALILLLSGCMTETTRTITTDKAGTVTDQTVTRKGSDPATLKLVSIAAEIYLPRRAVVIRQEKADHDMKRLLRGWRGRQEIAFGPITADEIQNRWKP